LTDTIRQDPGSQMGKNAPFGTVERKIARRYLGAKKSEGGVAIIAWISFICITLAILALISIMSIMNGYRAKVIELTLGIEGHMYVGVAGSNIPADRIQEIEARLSALPNVKEAYEFSQNSAAISANERFAPGFIQGISYDNLMEFEEISDNVIFGSLQGFGQGWGSDHQIAIGSRLAAGLGLQAGDKIRIITPRSRSNPMTGSTPIMKSYTVGAVFESGLFKTDESTIFMELDQSQLLFADGAKSGEIQMRFDDPDRVDQMIDDVREAVGLPIFIETWRDRNVAYAVALDTEKAVMGIIFIFVVIISVFPILAAMIMLVKNKAKDIAILRTMGATRASILRIFFISGATIGFFGTLFGLVLGILFCLNIQAIQAFLEWVTQRPLFPPEVYELTGGVPAKIIWSEVIFVASCGFIISAIATFFPAFAASRTDPVEALRYE